VHENPRLFLGKVNIFEQDTLGYKCFRVPGVLKTRQSLLVFVESRRSSCGDQAPKDITLVMLIHMKPYSYTTVCLKSDDPLMAGGLLVRRYEVDIR